MRELRIPAAQVQTTANAHAIL